MALPVERAGEEHCRSARSIGAAGLAGIDMFAGMWGGADLSEAERSSSISRAEGRKQNKTVKMSCKAELFSRSLGCYVLKGLVGSRGSRRTKRRGCLT